MCRKSVIIIQNYIIAFNIFTFLLFHFFNFFKWYPRLQFEKPFISKYILTHPWHLHVFRISFAGITTYIKTAYALFVIDIRSIQSQAASVVLATCVVL